jgi:competence protein ComEA
MNEKEDKKHIIIPVITFLIGTIIGAVLTLLLFPTECPECSCEKELEIVEQPKVKSSTEEKVIEEKPIVSDREVSLPISESKITVDIAGAVNNPGVYSFNQGSRVVDVIDKAGGFSKGVGYSYVSMKMNLSSLIEDHQKIYIPFQEQLYCEVKNLQYVEVQQTSQEQGLIDDNTSDSTQTCININTASLDELITLNGIGESTAQKIIDARPFEAVEDILNVAGIGDATFEKFKHDICV